MKDTEKEAMKQLEKFKKDFVKLMAKYPRVIVSIDRNDNLYASKQPLGPYTRVQTINLQ